MGDNRREIWSDMKVNSNSPILLRELFCALLKVLNKVKIRTTFQSDRQCRATKVFPFEFQHGEASQLYDDQCSLEGAGISKPVIAGRSLCASLQVGIFAGERRESSGRSTCVAKCGRKQRRGVERFDKKYDWIGKDNRKEKSRGCWKQGWNSGER